MSYPWPKQMPVRPADDRVNLTFEYQFDLFTYPDRPLIRPILSDDIEACAVG
jgi:hypothetical protein